MAQQLQDDYDANIRKIQVLGRVFTSQDVMHLVLGVDPTTGQCRVSRRDRETTEVISMALEEVVAYLSDRSVCGPPDEL